MAISLSGETVLPFAAAAKRLPALRGGRPVNPSTLWRWATAGVRGVKLETVRVGSVNCTSVEALERFVAALSGQKAVTAKAERKDAKQDRVERELDAMGA